MRISILIIGTVISLAGLTFWLQGLAIVGPPSSFMYKNPEWITNGMFILAFGVITIVIGAVIGRSKMSF